MIGKLAVNSVADSLDQDTVDSDCFPQGFPILTTLIGKKVSQIYYIQKKEKNYLFV